ncbi:hypothetical protein ACTD5D_39690 [Nocardia takedensis]|uniref:hypothetical protein n=1 Tax=Nocardia takedensis TaxID=259390 RepID=UPI003F764683
MNLTLEVSLPPATDTEPLADVVEVSTDPAGSRVLIVATPGPPGPPGPPGAGEGGGGSAWWTGTGPPATVLGSAPGDHYIDTTTGTIYRLGD